MTPVCLVTRDCLELDSTLRDHQGKRIKMRQAFIIMIKPADLMACQDDKEHREIPVLMACLVHLATKVVEAMIAASALQACRD